MPNYNATNFTETKQNKKPANSKFPASEKEEEEANFDETKQQKISQENFGAVAAALTPWSNRLLWFRTS